MKNQRLFIAAMLLVWLTGGIRSAYGAEISDEALKSLLKRIDDLEAKVKKLEGGNGARVTKQVEAQNQKVNVQERKTELANESGAEKGKAAPTITAGPTGLGIRSGDGNFAATVHGVLQVDNRTFFADGGAKGNDGFLVRRARPTLEGTVYRDFDFLFVPDFGGTAVQIFDAYLNYRYRPELQLRIGKFKTPVGLEQMQADRDITFNERSMVTDLVPNRDVGFQLHGEIGEGLINYALGIFNGVGDTRNSGNFDFEDDREFSGRIFLQPFKKSKVAALQGFGVGAGSSYESTHSATGLPGTTGGTLPGFTTDGQQQFFAYNPMGGATVIADGSHWRVSPQGWYYHGPFGLLGEYAISNQRVTRTTAPPLASAQLGHTAWQITGSWLLTGDDATFKSVNPKQPFDPGNGHWGALQLAARFAQLDIDRAAFPLFSNPATSAWEAQAWSIGLNWYLNRNIRVGTSFSHTVFTGGGGAGPTVPAIVTRQPENVLFTRVQLAF